MSQSKQLITKYKRLNTARQIEESVSEPSNTAYYVFLGNHLSYPSSTIPQPNDSISVTGVETYRNMVYGKRVTPNDIKLMIPRNDYALGEVYDMYDDQVGESNVALFNSNYYAIVNADSYSHVFKCLDNNNGSYSTVKPEFSEVDANDEIYQTSDGYVWKYMYSADSTTISRFSTSNFFPVVPNTSVSSAAIDGLLTVIKVTNAGRGYDNYCNGIFRVADLKVDGNSKKYSINSALSAPLTANFFKDCYIYITSGTAAGQYSKIVEYSSNSTVKAILLETEFGVAPAADSTFEISPSVKIVGDGTETSSAAARAIINTTSNSIQKIEMLNLGGGYKYATANVLAHSSVAVSNTAVIRPIYSPPGGHGYDSAAELGATRICISTKISSSDIGVPLTNDYATIGLLQDPLFDNVVINYNSAQGTFLPTETIYRVDGVQVSTTATVSSTTSVVTGGTSDDFVNQFSAGEYIYIKTSSGYQLAVVNSVTNSTYMTLTENSYYNSTSAYLYKTNMGSKLTAVNITSSALTGNLITYATSNAVYGKGTNFATDLLANGCLYIYANSTGAGEVKTIKTVTYPTYSVNASSNVNSTTDFISISGHTLVNNDVVQYYTATGNTVISGLANQAYYYVVSAADTTGFKLSATRGGANVNITAGLAEIGHYFKLQKLTVDSNMSFSNTDAKAQEINYSITANTIAGTQTSKGFITSVSTGSITLTNVAGIFNTGDFIIGDRSGATGVITTIYRNDIAKSFDTFVQMNKYIATPSAKTFTQDEVIFQSETSAFTEQHATAYLHSVIDRGSSLEMYMTNQIGVVNLAQNIIGYTSGAIATVTNKYSPELIPESGKVLFIEKLDPVTRTSSTSETIKFIFEF